MNAPAPLSSTSDKVKLGPFQRQFDHFNPVLETKQTHEIKAENLLLAIKARAHRCVTEVGLQANSKQQRAMGQAQLK